MEESENPYSPPQSLSVVPPEAPSDASEEIDDASDRKPNYVLGIYLLLLFASIVAMAVVIEWNWLKGFEWSSFRRWFGL